MFTLKDSVLCAVNVGKLLGINPHLLFTRESTLEKIFICVVNMENALREVQPSVNIEKFRLEESSTSVANVGNP